MSAPLTAQEQGERIVEVEGTQIRLLSYRIGERYFARAHDASLGDIVGRASGSNRDEAERAAMDSASLRLGLSAVRASMAKTLEHLGRKSER